MKDAAREPTASSGETAAVAADAHSPAAQADADAALIQLRNVYKVFGNQPDQAIRLADQGVARGDIFEQTGSTVAVDNVSLDIREGEIFVVMGLSGSGKSTLLRMINRLIDPTRGSVLYRGDDIARMNRRTLIGLRRKHMSMVFQHFALFPYLTVLDNVRFGLETAGVAAQTAQDKSMQVLESVGLSDNAASYPGELSGGMQQRVGLARALAVDPDVLLMDEAFSALDPLIRGDMQDQLLALQKERPRTIIFVSHDLDEAMRIGDRLAIMESGKVLQAGTPEEILEAPADDYVRAFFGGVDVSHIYHAGDIATRRDVSIIPRRVSSVMSALGRLRSRQHEFGYVEGRDRHFMGVVSVASLLRSLRAGADDLAAAYLPVEPVETDAGFDDLIDALARLPCPAPVVDPRGRFCGVVSRSALLDLLHRPEGGP